MDGKSDWMAFGLPVEGEDGPYAGESVAEAPTCRPDETASEVAERLRRDGAERAVVVNDHDVVVGMLELEAVTEDAAEASVLEVMEVSPTTVRPSVLLSSLAEGDADQVLVTSSDGRLMGVVERRRAAEESDPEAQRMADEFHEVVTALEERFGDREPTEEEVRSFLRERLVEEGKSPEEADRFLATMGDE